MEGRARTALRERRVRESIAVGMGADKLLGFWWWYW